MAEMKYTEKEGFGKLVELARASGDELLVAFAEKKLGQVMNKTSKGREVKPEVLEARAELEAKIVDVLGEADAPMTAAEITAAIGDVDVTPGKVSARLTAMKNADEPVVENIKQGKKSVYILK